MTAPPRVVMTFAADATMIDEGDSFRLQRGGRDVVVRFTGADQGAFWTALRHGADADARRRSLVRLPAMDRLALAALLESLRRGSWIVEELRLNDRPLLARTLVSDWYEPAPVDPAQAYVLSRFALIRHDPRGLLVESPRCHARVTLGAEAVGRCVAMFAQGVEPGWDIDPEMAAIVRMFVESGLVVVRHPDGSTAEDHDATLREWDFHDLLFHARSRAGRHRDPYGKTDPPHPPDGSLAPATHGGSPDRISLVVPGAEDIARRDQSFDSVLEGRRTIRAAPGNPLTIVTLGEFLYRSARIQRSDDGSPAGARRPFASAAGRDELVLYLSVHRCTGLAPGLYRYDASAHALDPVETTEAAGKLLAKFCGPAPIGVQVIVAAQFDRINCRYRSLAYSLILRNAGSLLQTMYLVATALGRAPCAIGAGDADLFARITGLPYEVQGSVADFVLR